MPDVAASQATLKFPSLFPEAEQSDSVLTPQGSILHPAGSTDLKPSDLAEQCAELPPGKRRIATEATKSQPPHTPVPTHPQSQPGSTCLNGSENGCQHSQCEAQQSTEDLPLGNKAATSNRVLPTGCNTVEAPSAPLSRAEETRPPPNVPMTESTRLCSSKHLVQNGRKPTNTNQNSTSQTTRDRKQQSASTTSLPNQSSACFNSGCGGSDDEEDDQHRKKLKSQCEADPSAPQGDDDTSSDSDPENSELPGCIGGAEDQEISNEINPSVVSGTVSTALEQNPPEDGSGHVIRETQTGNLCLQSDSPLATQLPQGGAKPGSVSHNEPLLPDVAASQATLKKFPSLCPEAEQSDSVLTPQGSILHPVGSTDLKPSDLAEQCAELPPGKRQIATEATKSQPPHTPVPTHPQSQPGSTCLNGSENGCQHSQCEAQQSTEDLPLANKAATSNRVLPTGCNTVEPPSAPLSRAEETRSPPNVPMTESTSLCSSKHLVQNGRKPTNTNQNSTSQTTRDRKQQSASTTSLPNQSSACFNSGCGGSDDEDDQHRKKLKSQCEADPSAPQGDDDTSSDSDPENSELPGCIGGAEDQEISNEINPSVVSGTVSTALEQNPPEDGSGHVIRETQTGNLCLQSDSPLATQLPQGGAKPGSVSHNEPLLPDVAASQATLKKFPSLCPEAEQSDSVLTPQGSILHPVGSTDLKPSDLAEQCAELPPGKRQIATEATKSQPPHTPVPTHPQSQPGSTCLNGSENGCQHSQCEAQQSTEDLPLANKAATSNRVLPTGCNTVEPPSAPLSRAEETRSPPNVPMTESTRLCSSKHLVQNGRKPTNTNQNSTSQTTRDRKQQSASTTSLPNQSSACFNSGCGGSDDEEDDQHRKKLKSQCEADPSAPQGDDDTSSDSDPENSELPGCIGGAEDQEISNEINPSVVSGTVSTALEQNPPEDGSGHVIRETQTGNLCLQSDSPLATQLPQGGAKPGSVSHNEPLLPDVAASQATLKKFPSLCPEAEQSDSVLTPQGSILHPVGSTDLKPSDLAEQCAELPPGKRQIATEATKSQPPHTPVPTHPQSQPGSTCLNGSENGCQHSQCEAQQSTEDLPLANKAATSNRVLPTGCNTVEPPSAPLSRAEETRSPPNVPMTESTRLCSSKHLVQNGRKPTNTNQNSTSQTTRDRKQQSASTTSLPNQSSACFNSGCGGSDDEDDQHRKKLKSQCEADPSAPQGDDDTSSDSDPENSELPGCIGGAEDQEISNEINPSVVSGTVSTALEQNPPEDGSGHVIRETQTGNLCLQSDSPLATQLPQGGAKPGSVSHNEPLLPDVAASQATLKKFPSLCPEAEQSDSVLTPQGSILHPVGSTDLKPSDLAEQCAELPPGKRQIATEATKSQPPHTPVPTHPQSQPGSTCLNGSENGCQHSQCEAQQSTEDLPLANKAATSNRVLPTGCNTVEPPSAPLSRAEETRSPPNVPMTESTRLCSSKHLVQNGRKPTNTNQNSTSQTTRDRKQQSASTTSLPNQSSACFNSGCGGSDDEDDQHRKKLKSQCEADPSAPQGDDDTSSDSDPENSELPGCIGGAEDQEISNEINPSVVSGTVSTALEQNPPEDGSGHVIRETQTGNLCLQSDSPVATQLPQGGAKPGSVSHNEPLLPDVAASQATLKKFPSLCPEAEQSDSVLTPQGSILHPAGSTDLKPSDLAEQSAELPPGKRRIATEATKSQPPHTPVPTHPQSHPGSTCLNGSENGCQHSQCEAQQSTEDLPLANKAATSNRVLPTGCNTVEAPSAPLSRAEETRPPPNVSMTESTRLCSSKHLVQNGRKPTNTNQNSTSQTTRDRKQQSASTTSLPNQSSACFNSGCGGSDDEEDDQHRKKLKSQCEADPSAPQGDDDTSSDSDPENSELPGCIGGAEDQEISNEINPSVVSGTVSTALEQNPPEVGSEHVIRETQTGNLCLQSDSPVATQLPQGGAKPGSVSHNEPLLPDVAASQAVEVLFPSLFPKGEQSDPILTPQGSTLHPAGSTDLKPSDLAEQSVPCKKLVTTHKTEATGSQPPGTPLPTHTLVPTHPQSCPFPDELALHSHKAISIDVVEEDSYISADSAHSTLPSTIKQFHDDTVESEELAKTEAHNFTSNDNTRPPSHHGGVPDAAKLPSFESNESSHIHQFTSIQGTSSTQDSQLITGVTNHTTSEESQQVPGTFLLQSPAVLSHGTGSISSPVSSNTAIEASASISLATSLPVHFSGLSDTEATWMHPGPQMPHVVSLSAVNTIPQECTNLSPNHDFQDGNSFLYLTTPFTSCHSRQTAGMSEDTAVQVGILLEGS